jgi:hypothetical protein
VRALSSFEQQESSKDNNAGAKLEEEQRVHKDSRDDDDHVVSPWSSLPRDLLELIVQEVTFVDYLRLPSVCKGWSGLTRSRSTPGFFLPTAGFLPPPSGMAVCRGIPRYTAGYRANSNFKPKSIATASSNGFERYTAV